MDCAPAIAVGVIAMLPFLSVALLVPVVSHVFDRVGVGRAYRIGLLSEIVGSPEHLDDAVGEIVDALLLGMGERYDVIVTAKDGVFPLVASAEGKNAVARALLSTAAGSAPAASVPSPARSARRSSSMVVRRLVSGVRSS